MSEREFRTVKCPICKKQFLPAPMHAYKLYNKRTKRPRRFCSYTCFRKAQNNTKAWRSVNG